MSWFWRMRFNTATQTEPEYREPPRELTGIERHEAEEAERLKAEQQRVWNEEQATIRTRIAELEKQIAPQLCELDGLRGALVQSNFTQQWEQYCLSSGSWKPGDILPVYQPWADIRQPLFYIPESRRKWPYV